MNELAHNKDCRRRGSAACVWLRPCIALLAGVFAAGTLGQYRVNNQVNRGMYGESCGSVRYSYNQSYSSSTSVLLPSEVRNQYVRSGATPSMIRMNYASVGPLAPGGAQAYLPQQSQANIRYAQPGSSVNWVNPTAQNRTPGYSTGASSFTSSPVGSIRYSGTASPASAPRAPNQITASVGFTAPINGSIRYGTP